LTDIELASIEGVERRAVEARIQTLRNIQILLDAAMLQFQQYLTASSFSTATGANNSTQTVESSSNEKDNSVSNNAGGANECSPTSSSGNEKIEKTSQTKEEAMPKAVNQ
jgi:E3 ubiquitin-protein ligase synoviolin